MGHTFVSYSRKDSEIVDRLVKKLEAAGFDVWIDRGGIQGGEQWMERIVNALDRSDAIIAVLSPNSVASHNVRTELSLAHEAEKRIIPADAKEVAIPAGLRYQLAGLHRIDLESNFDAGCQELIDALGGERSKKPIAKAPQQLSRIVGTWERTQEGTRLESDSGVGPLSIQKRKEVRDLFKGKETTPGVSPVDTFKFQDNRRYYRRMAGFLLSRGKYEVDLSAEPKRLKLKEDTGEIGWAIFSFIDSDTIRLQFSDAPSTISNQEDAAIYRRKK